MADDWLGINGGMAISWCDGGDPTGALNGEGAWQCAGVHEHWVILDLGQTYTIKKVQGRSNTKGDPTAVNIYVSDDPDNWGDAVATDIATWLDTDNWVGVNTTDKDGRYIKVLVWGSELGGELIWGGDPPFTIFDAYGSVAGGQQLTYAASDTMAISDGISAAARFNVSLADNLALSDSAAAAMTFRQTISDTMSISDAIAAAAAYKVALADNLSISDTISAAATYAIALADTMNISDALAAGWKFYVALADTMSISDTMTYEAFVGEVKKRLAGAMVRKIGIPTPINLGVGA